MSLPAREHWWRPFGQYGPGAVAHVDLAPNRRHEASALRWLDDKELGRWREFVHPGARRRYGLCRAALRALLCERLGCGNDRLSFGSSRYDKPFALVDYSPAPVSFNVSHSGNHGLIVLASEGRIGIDVEERTRRRDFGRLIEAAFGKDEQAALTRAGGQDRIYLFFKLWTIKEALIKALGTGLSYDPANFEAPSQMRLGASSGIHRFAELPDMAWRVSDLGNEDFAAAIALEENPSANAMTDSEMYSALSRRKRPVH
jgi:4'-phosphopantetheinyl transferase